MWAFHLDYELSLTKVLPLDVDNDHQQGELPVLVNTLPVNALNFCGFSLVFCSLWDESIPSRPNAGPSNPQTTQPPAGSGPSEKAGETKQEEESKPRDDNSEGVEQSGECQTPGSEAAAPSPSHEDLVKTELHSLIAVPNTFNSGAIDIYHLPSKRRVSTFGPGTNSETGMVMAVNIFIGLEDELHVAAAYEDGHVMLFICTERFRDHDVIYNNPTSWKWDKVYDYKTHKQPALSIDVAPGKVYFASTAADSILATHSIPIRTYPNAPPEEEVARCRPHTATSVGSPGMQSLRIRSDAFFMAAACWDNTVKVFDSLTLENTKTITWHKDGCSALAFGLVREDQRPGSGPLRSDGVPRFSLTVAEAHRMRRVNVQDTHWLICGSKAGRISMWEIY